MKTTDPRITAALRKGGTNRGIARQLCTTPKTVADARRLLDLPPIPGGRPTKFGSPQDMFRAYTEPVDGGHRRWTGWTTNSGTPCARWRGKDYTAYRIAFVMRWNRAPEGEVLPGCDYPRCVEPDHVDDRPMREKNRTLLTAIFGVAA